MGHNMVDVAQLVEHRVVAPVVVGSSPIIHPKLVLCTTLSAFFAPAIKAVFIFILLVSVQMTLISTAAAKQHPSDNLWQTLKVGMVEFHFHSEDQKAVTSLLNNADQYIQVILSHLELNAPKGQVTVKIATNMEEFLNLQPGQYQAPFWAAGISYSRLNLIILQVKGGKEDRVRDIETVFRHEFAHLALFWAAGEKITIPLWFNEGYAMFEADEWGFGCISTLMKASVADRLYTLADLTNNFPRDTREVNVAYCQSIDFFSYFMQEYQLAGFRKLMGFILQGISIEDAIYRSTGISLPKLERNWLRDITVRYNWIPLITSSSTIWFLITLLFLVSYLKKRQQSKEKRAKMELEEQLLSLYKEKDDFNSADHDDNSNNDDKLPPNMMPPSDTIH